MQVCIQHSYCPLCYRGGSTMARVSRDSPRIDKEQALCSRAFGGLPFLDLQAEGKRCPSPCKLTCVVCGNVMAFGCEPEFEQALSALDDYEEESLETRVEVLEGMRGLARLGQHMAADLERRFARRLRGLGMAWLPRWKRLAHIHCTKKAGCDCLVPVVVDACSTHGTRVPKPKRRSVPQENIETHVPDKSMPVPVPVLDHAARESGARPTSMLKAAWLGSPHTSSVRVPPQGPPPAKPRPPPRKPDARLESAAAGCARLDTQAGLAPATKPAPATTATKNARKRDHRLETASKLSQRLDGWMGSAPKRAKPAPEPLSRPRPPPRDDAQPPCTLPTRHPCFSAKRHLAEFDPYQHGYLRKNGVDMYRFYDGFEVRVFSGVNELTEDGRLLPM